MTSFLKIMLLASAALSAVGCAHASGSSTPGNYSMEFYSRNPEAMASVISHNYVQETNAHTYRECVMSGRCYGYPGGMTGDYWHYYRGIIPPQPVVPAAPPSTAPPATVVPPASSSAVPRPVTQSQLDAVHGEAQEARRRADAALAMHHRLRDTMTAP